MTDLTPETVAALRGRAGVSDRLSLSREQVLALLDAADERDRLLTIAPCSETHTAPFDFAYCSTHDRTFALGEHCDYARLSEVGYLEKQAREQRVRAIRAEDERDKLAATIKRVRALAPVDVSDWDEDDPLMVTAAAIHRALDGTEDGPTT